MNNVVKGITKKPDDLAKFDLFALNVGQKDTVNIEMNRKFFLGWMATGPALKKL